MRLFSKPVIIIVITIIVITGGFFLLIRGCLSRYDERFALTPGMYFEKDGKGVLVNIVEHEQATSYSQKGGMVSKSVIATYYIQTNDAVSAALLQEKKVKENSDIEYYPVEMMGASGNMAWMFMGELMAFDPFTLEKKCDTKMLEEKNPSLAGKFPKERQYYQFSRDNGHIYFTAIDGNKWELNTNDLVAVASNYNPDDSPLKQQITELEKTEKLTEDLLDSSYEQNVTRPSRQYTAKEISYEQYNRMHLRYNNEQEGLYKRRDSIRDVKSKLETRESSAREIERTIESLQRSNPSYYSMKTNQDTVSGIWYGLYSSKEIQQLHDRVAYRSENDETARRQLYTGQPTRSVSGDWMIDKDKTTAVAGTTSFLHGGFLLDKKTAMPVHLDNPASFLIVHKEQIGREAKILLSRIGYDGKPSWTFNTQLPEWMDWIFNGKELFVFGVDNKNLSNGECNVLWCIDLANGKAAEYDYFSNKIITAEKK